MAPPPPIRVRQTNPPPPLPDRSLPWRLVGRRGLKRGVQAGGIGAAGGGSGKGGGTEREGGGAVALGKFIGRGHGEGEEMGGEPVTGPSGCEREGGKVKGGVGGNDGADPGTGGGWWWA